MTKRTKILLIIVLVLGIAFTAVMFIAFNTKDKNDVPVIENITNQLFNNEEKENKDDQDAIKEQMEEEDTTFIAFSEDDKKNTNTNTSTNTNKNTNNSSSANQNTNNTVTNETNEEGTELIDGLVNNGDGSYSLPEIPLE